VTGIMRITIHGSYGTGNRGDDLTLGILLRFLAGIAPGATVTILCRSEDRLSSFLERELEGIDLQLKPLCATFRKQPLKVIRASTTCDLFILGGGSLLWGQVPGNLLHWLIRPLVVLACRRRLAFYVPGIHSIDGGLSRFLLGWVARRTSFLSVQDNIGARHLADLGIPEERILVGADPAFLLRPSSVSSRRLLVDALELRDRRLVGLSIRNWGGRLSAGLFAHITQEILEDPSVTLIYFALNTSGHFEKPDMDDLSVAGSLLRTLPPEDHSRVLIIDDSYSYQDMLSLAGACDYVIGMRLRSLIFATIAGTPFGAIRYDEKIAAYMEMIARSDRLLDIDDLQEPDSLTKLVQLLESDRKHLEPDAPAPELQLVAAELCGRVNRMHTAFAEELHRDFSQLKPHTPSRKLTP
jgi:polysaccharide pyruvyl transferase WcaK-like protein